MQYYALLKHLHVTCVGLSGLGFVLRAILLWRKPALLAQPWLRIAPHAVDSILLASALSMVFLSSQYPFVLAWLTAKVLGLLAYILCGTMALKRARGVMRPIYFVMALCCYAYIVGVALARSPLSYAAW